MRNLPSSNPEPTGENEYSVIIGSAVSAAYMAPEQARGQAVDKRTDIWAFTFYIWAFGVVLYEMLTGQRLFAGETVSDTPAGVLKNEIDLATLPSGRPPVLRQLLRRCLERNPKNRMRDIGEGRSRRRRRNRCRAPKGHTARSGRLTASQSLSSRAAHCAGSIWTVARRGPWPSRAGALVGRGTRTVSSRSGAILRAT